MAEKPGDAEALTYDVVGPVCETGDTFARDRRLPRFSEPDELVAFMSAGAYGASMSSEYNAAGRWRLRCWCVAASSPWWRPRPVYEEMLAREPLAPPWL